MGENEEGGNFIGRNIGGLIFAIICVVIANIGFFAEHDSGSKLFLTLSFLFIPIIFIVWVIADVIRRAIHPDMVIASGCWTLLKERIFWRIGPQVIASLIVLTVLMNCAESYVESRPTKDVTSLIIEYEEIIDKIVLIEKAVSSGNDTPSLEAEFDRLTNRLIPVLEELAKHERRLTEEERMELWRISQKLDLDSLK